MNEALMTRLKARAAYGDALARDSIAEIEQLIKEREIARYANRRNVEIIKRLRQEARREAARTEVNNRRLQRFLESNQFVPRETHSE